MWFLTRVFSGQCPHTPSDDCSPRFSSAPGHHSVHLSSAALSGAEAHPLPPQGLSGVWFGQTGACSYRKALAFLSTMSRQLLEVFQPGLASLLQGTHSASHTSTRRDRFTQTFNFLRHFKNKTLQKIVINRAAKAEDVQPGERAIAESSSSFSCSNKNHLSV